MRMKDSTVFRIARGANPGLLVLGILSITLLVTAPAADAANLDGLIVMGVAPDGTETQLTDFRWLVEEDQTYHVPVDNDGKALGGTNFDPNWQQGNDGLVGGETLSVSFHDSYMPVVAKGCVGDAAWQTAAACKEVAAVLDPAKNYYVSVVPRHSGAEDPVSGRPAGYSIGGAVYDPDGTIVYVHENPIQTAQISILIFEDNNSINGAPDLPREDPALDADGDGLPDNPMDGFQIIVEDGGGRYGASAGVQSQDAFGNPLGTQYDEFGNVIGFEPLITGPNGRLTIKNLAPGKYGIQAIPPAGQGWQQTSTIEGTKIIDTWVKANEPPFFAEFGPPGFHAFLGFVKPFSDPDLSGGATLSGKIVNNHMSRPPDYAFYNGACFGHTTPWVGLNEVTGGLPGKALFAASTVGECDFSISGVPDGDYQLVVWDTALDLIIASKGVSIVGGACNTPDGSCNFVEVPVFQWFHRQEHRVFNDENGNGIWDANEGLDEVPINDQAVLVRWRDGTVYQENVTDFTGAYTFDQVFPFFSWLVTEVDFVRFEATGLTTVIDNGGPIPDSALGFPGEDDLTFGRTIAPQDQTNPREGAGMLCEDGITACTADTDCFEIGGGTCAVTSFCEANPDICIETDTYRTELGPVLTAGFQGFIGQTNAFLWGKGHYPDIAPGLAGNGGISGIVFYAITRAEDDPASAAAEPWEPGIPGVTVNLYNSLGQPLNSTTTDSWDDSIPTGCKWGNGATDTFRFSPDGANFFEQDCYDGLRAFNQVRPAVFDGGYAFDDVCTSTFDLETGTCLNDEWQGFIAPGNFIVEVVPPSGYEILKPQDKNVDFGDEYEEEPTLTAKAALMAKAALPVVPECVGVDTLIPPYLTLFPDQQIQSPFAWSDTDNDGIDDLYTPTYRPLCDSKEVILTAGANAAADFWLFTEVPVAAHANGFILDDTQNEFDPNSPNFGEKYAPPFVPVTIRDWSGRIISKTLSDQYGTYNFLGPSTITTNLPAPSGMSPNMLTTCMNDPGDDPNNPDPNWNQLYSTFCYNFQYMPGVTTYLDTPVVPVAAFTGPDQFPLDCEFPDGTPRIWEVQGDGIGPYVAAATGIESITITSMGTGSVQNPNYCNAAAGSCPDGADTVNKTILRDYGFGATAGEVWIGDQLIPAAWGPDEITATLPADTTTGQLRIVRGDNQTESVTAVTVQVGLRQGASVAYVTPSGGALAHDIQNAIDMAGANDLILVGCGTANEMVVMWKPVQLQGSGECTTINAVKAPTDKLEVWRGMVDGLIAGGNVDLLPGQEVGPGAPEPTTLWNEEGAGILVLAKSSGPSAFDHNSGRNRDARIDGFTIRGADTGGGIIANGFAKYLQISNNRIANNSGFYGGGIRVGHPTLTAEQPNGGFDYTDGENDYVSIHHNQVVFNGGQGGVGGGISMCTGSDSYQVTKNWVCGNFSLGEGGGIGHTGLSDGLYTRINPSGGGNKDQYWVVEDFPLIADNHVIFNESFFQGSTISGGGIFIGGAPALPLAPGGLTPGAGNVQVIGNLIQGNSAGAGDGGGLRLAGVNGRDVAANPDNVLVGDNKLPRPWYGVDVFNNMLVNNVAALAGGGISMRDAVDVRLVHNTIANNDSMATAGEAFAPNSPNQSTPQDGAGIASRAHSTQLAAASGSVGTFSDPSPFADNIIWQNRQFFFFVDDTSGCTPGDPSCESTYGVCPDVTGALNCPGGGGLGFDLAVLGTAGTLACNPGASCILTGEPNPLFAAGYVNGDRSSVLQQEQTTGIQTPAAFDEGGNFIRLKYGPLALYNDQTPNDGAPGDLYGDYHIQGGSPAVDAGFDLTGTYPNLLSDFDGEPRPSGTGVDIGADEVQP